VNGELVNGELVNGEWQSPDAACLMLYSKRPSSEESKLIALSPGKSDLKKPRPLNGIMGRGKAVAKNKLCLGRGF
jgi:hypothetical protein